MPQPSTRKVLEKALVADPDDLAAHAAYADWLTQEGDPRGEFIQVQLALEEPGRPAKERKELQEREKKLLKSHGRKWLGELADYLLDQKGVDDYWKRLGGFQFQLARGWLDRIRVPQLSVDFAKMLAKAPQSKLLRRLVIECEAYLGPSFGGLGEMTNPGACVHALLCSPYLANLRVFECGSIDGAADLVARMPRIEELWLCASGAYDVPVESYKLFSLKSLSNLRILRLENNYHYELEVLAGNPNLKKLTHILFQPATLERWDTDAHIDLAGVRALVRSPHLKSLTHLQLRLCSMGDKGCEEMVRSGIFKRLKMLDVVRGRITDEGAAILAACPDIKNLELLEISYNYLTKAGIAALKRAGIGKVQATDQFEPGGGDELEYLTDGIME